MLQLLYSNFQWQENLYHACNTKFSLALPLCYYAYINFNYQNRSDCSIRIFWLEVYTLSELCNGLHQLMWINLAIWTLLEVYCHSVQLRSYCSKAYLVHFYLLCYLGYGLLKWLPRIDKKQLKLTISIYTSKGPTYSKSPYTCSNHRKG